MVPTAGLVHRSDSAKVNEDGLQVHRICGTVLELEGLEAADDLEGLRGVD